MKFVIFFFVNINGSTCYLLYTNTEQIDKQDQNKVCGVALTDIREELDTFY